MPKPKAINQNKKIGMYYEGLAVAYLVDKGYHLVEKNYHCKLGEIDIIAKDSHTIVFIEVKYRKNSLYGYPREYVDSKKQQRIIRVATYYLMVEQLLDASIRFDVIEILQQDINHLEAAFY